MYTLMMLGSAGLMLGGKAMMLRKAGENGWKALIPFYGDYLISQTAGCGFGYVLGMVFTAGAYGGIFSGEFSVSVIILALLGLLLQYMVCRSLAEAFRKRPGFAFGLLLLPMVFYSILGFGDASYDPSVRQEAEGEAQPIEAEGTVKEAA